MLESSEWLWRLGSINYMSSARACVCAFVCACRIPFWDEYKRSRSRLGVSSACHTAPPPNPPPPPLIPGLNFSPQFPAPAPGITQLMARTCSLTSSIDPARIGAPGPRRGRGGVCVAPHHLLIIPSMLSHRFTLNILPGGQREEERGKQ